jgi:peptidylprolyl isomerase
MQKIVKFWGNPSVQPILGDEVTIHYEGKYNNKIFDSSRRRNEPFTYILGKNAPIPGFDKGVFC